MDPRAQDVVRCDVCDNNTAEMHCDTCFVNLCKACVGEHMFDESVDHKIVKFKSRKTTPIYPSCLYHSKERCEMYCTHCDTPICSACVASDKHTGHKISQLLEKCDIIKKNIQEDNEELRSKLAPLYQKMLHDLEMRIKEVEEKSEEASKLISQQGDKWHKEIDIIVSQVKTQLEKIKEKGVKNLKVNKVKTEIALSKISSVLQSNEETLESNDLRTKNTKVKTLHSIKVWRLLMFRCLILPPWKSINRVSVSSLVLYRQTFRRIIALPRHISH